MLGAGLFDVVAIVGSRGAVDSLRPLLEGLKQPFPAAIVVLVHRSPRFASLLSRVLSRWSSAPIADAEHGQSLRPGEIVLAPADRHLLLGEDGRVALDDGPRVHFARPAADPLLASMARVYGPRCIAVVLSGDLGDGAAGVRAVKTAGGRVVVEDETTAERFGMPGAALGTGCVDFLLPIGAIAPALVSLTCVPGAAELFRVPIGPCARLAG